MNKSYLLKIQLSFIAIVMLLIVFIVAGIQTDFGNLSSAANQKYKFLTYKFQANKFNTYENNNLLASILSLFSLGESKTISASLNAEAVPVLVYHGIVDNPDRFNITEKIFFDHMNSLYQKGYRTISLEEFRDFIKFGKQIPDRSIVITFDDGRSDSFIGADPILDVFNYNAVMFIATEASLLAQNEEGGHYLVQADIERMLSTKRWSIESHARQTNGGMITIDAEGTKDQFLSNKMFIKEEGRVETEDEYEKRLDSELMGSRDDIKQFLKKDAIAFSYPFSDYGQQEVNNAGAEDKIASKIKNTYSLAFRQTWPGDANSWNYPGDKTNLLRRIEPETSWSGERLVKEIEKGKPKKTPFTSRLVETEGWSKPWGNVIAENGTLALSATEKTTGTMTVLNGGRLWKNYTLEVAAEVTGDVFTLVNLYSDNNSYISCDYSKNNVRIHNWFDGQSFLIAEKAIKRPAENATYGMWNYQNYVGCQIDGKDVISAEKSEFLDKNGSVGIKIWDPSFGNSKAIITSFEVKNKNSL
jgi:peptidoglycan/xylan/chitin deacetylase (PgdA/CDA1 family)